MARLLFAAALVAVLASPAAAQRTYPPVLNEAKSHVYKTVEGTELSLWVFTPKDHQPTDSRPAIVFFFGGGWKNGSPTQFEQQCRYLASRGMVAITADYRVASRQGVKAVECVRDAKSAIRWVRSHAKELGIDPQRLAAGGGSAGGHLAACAGVISEFDDAKEDPAVSSRPNAMVLFNPAVSFDPALAGDDRRAAGLSERMGVEPEKLSPAHHVQPRLPPALVLIGTKDFLIAGNRQFVERMKAAGNRCDLDLYEDREHGFFNYGRKGSADFLKATESMDRFLTSLGYLSGEPTVTAFFEMK